MPRGIYLKVQELIVIQGLCQSSAYPGKLPILSLCLVAETAKKTVRFFSCVVAETGVELKGKSVNWLGMICH